mgnify:CR=1 FL=1
MPNRDKAKHHPPAPQSGGEPPVKREHWGSRVGLILAMAGNAVGLGNFLRFPAKAAANGGGAFMVPYFIAFLILGIPLMWIEWGIGRYGGTLGHGTMPGVMHRIVKKPIAKYLGVLGIILGLLTAVYYCYIESWTLSFSYFSVTGRYNEIPGSTMVEKREEMGRFFKEFLGVREKLKLTRAATVQEIQSVTACTNASEVAPLLKYDPARDGAWDAFDTRLDQKKKPYVEVPLNAKYFSTGSTAYTFFLITVLLNFYFLYRGLSAGIEQLGKIGMPVLFVFAIILAIRVLTMGHPVGCSWSIYDGLNFLWVPKFDELGKASIWLAAAGQIFFTLSLGQGAIQAYASYLSNKDDVVLTGLSTASLNEFAEVVLGGSIAIPAAVAFFGPAVTTEIARSGSFDLGFQCMPLIFSRISMGWFFGAIWFGLLFIAGITSSVALLTPAITFLKDEMKLTHHKAVLLVTSITLVFSHACVFFYEFGMVDEMDYWVGTLGLVVFALLEVVLFMWIYGGENAWKEMHKGCDMHIPRIFYYIMKYITPIYILILLFAWGVQDGWGILVMQAVPVANRPYIWACRAGMLAVIALFMHFIWKRFHDEDKDSYWLPAALWGYPLLLLIASYPGLFGVDTNGMILLAVSWSLVFGGCAFTIFKMCSVPPKSHDDFPDDQPSADTPAA